MQGEAVQKLAHPNGVCAFRKFRCAVENVARNRGNAIFKSGSFCVLFGYSGLARKVNNGNLNIRIVFAALDCPFGCVATDVEQTFDRLRINDGKRFRESEIRIEMVESEPAFFELVAALGKAFVNSRPFAEVLKSFRFSVLNGVGQIVCTCVTDVFRKVHVYTGHVVGHYKESDFAERVKKVIGRYPRWYADEIKQK